MTERPILFSGPMVRAILEGRKTQTRRVVKPQPAAVYIGSLQFQDSSLWSWRTSQGVVRRPGIRCPYGVPGDRLWARETWFHEVGKDYENAAFADGTIQEKGGDRWRPDGWTPIDADIWRKRPSIHMPRWASRIDLELTGVRLERVQEISLDDAIAEGTEFCDCGADGGRCEFHELWDSINAKRGYPWADEDLPESLRTGHGCVLYGNPWVWVLAFKLHSMEAEKGT